MTYSIPLVRGREEETTGNWRARLTARVRRMVRIGKAGNELPRKGQVCLVLRGVEGRDLGQQAVVTEQTKSRVRIAYREQDGRHGSKLKNPGSLVLLENGLEMSRDEHGFVWVKREE
jgi:hypothetical protein